jgi:hypothetical protein
MAGAVVAGLLALSGCTGAGSSPEEDPTPVEETPTPTAAPEAAPTDAQRSASSRTSPRGGREEVTGEARRPLPYRPSPRTPVVLRIQAASCDRSA